MNSILLGLYSPHLGWSSTSEGRKFPRKSKDLIVDFLCWAEPLPWASVFSSANGGSSQNITCLLGLCTSRRLHLMVTTALCIGGRMLPGVQCLSTGVQHRLSRMSVSFLPMVGGTWAAVLVQTSGSGRMDTAFRDTGSQVTLSRPQWPPHSSLLQQPADRCGDPQCPSWGIGAVSPLQGRLGSLSHKQSLEGALRGQRQFPSVWAGTSAMKMGWGAQSMILGAVSPNPAQSRDPPQKPRTAS